MDKPTHFRAMWCQADQSEENEIVLYNLNAMEQNQNDRIKTRQKLS